jgi:glutamate formiminotransferase/formiminotetrahydrofolate cyclodeaminase
MERRLIMHAAGCKDRRRAGFPSLLQNAAFDDKRKNWQRREGEYEGLPKNSPIPEWKPDFGPAFKILIQGGRTASCRDFLVAFYINLNTTSTRLANALLLM